MHENCAYGHDSKAAQEIERYILRSCLRIFLKGYSLFITLKYAPGIANNLSPIENQTEFKIFLYFLDFSIFFTNFTEITISFPEVTKEAAPAILAVTINQEFSPKIFVMYQP